VPRRAVTTAVASPRIPEYNIPPRERKLGRNFFSTLPASRFIGTLSGVETSGGGGGGGGTAAAPKMFSEIK